VSKTPENYDLFHLIVKVIVSAEVSKLQLKTAFEMIRFAGDWMNNQAN